MLSQERLRQLYLYEPDTGNFIRRTSRGSKPKGTVAGFVGSAGYVLIEINGKSYKAHRLAWLYMTGKWPRELIDHINGIRNDNKFSNLREATHSVNMQNMRLPPKNNTTGYLGVYRHGNKYAASIYVQKKCIKLGLFSTPLDAHRAYISAKRKLHAGCTI